MYCTFCGQKIDDESNFCIHCGQMVRSYCENNEVKPKKDVKGRVFSFVGFGLGLSSFIFSLIPFLCFCSVFMSIPGLIFSNLGKTSDKASYAKKGKTFSVLGIVFGLIFSVSFIMLFVYIFSEGYYYYY